MFGQFGGRMLMVNAAATSATAGCSHDNRRASSRTTLRPCLS